MKSVPFLLLSLIIVFLSWSSTLAGSLTSAGIDTARNAMVVAARAEAVEAGLQMLNEGGNAIDAAVAAAFVIGVVEPYASGL
ncbi:MAG: gamma-glutamyltransferase, partial [bacterium]